jgi:hypothetical protein
LAVCSTVSCVFEIVVVVVLVAYDLVACVVVAVQSIVFINIIVYGGAIIDISALLTKYVKLTHISRTVIINIATIMTNITTYAAKNITKVFRNRFSICFHMKS